MRYKYTDDTGGAWSPSTTERWVSDASWEAVKGVIGALGDAPLTAEGATWTRTEASGVSEWLATPPGRIFVWAGDYRQAHDWCYENGHNPRDQSRIVIVTGDRLQQLRGYRLHRHDIIEKVGTGYAHRHADEVAAMFRMMRAWASDDETTAITDPGKGNTMRSTTDHITLIIHSNNDVALGTASGLGIRAEGWSKRAPGDRVDLDLGKNLVALRLMRGFVRALEARVGPDADSEHSDHTTARLASMEVTAAELEQRCVRISRWANDQNEALVAARDALSNIPRVIERKGR